MSDVPRMEYLRNCVHETELGPAPWDGEEQRVALSVEEMAQVAEAAGLALSPRPSVGEWRRPTKVRNTYQGRTGAAMMQRVVLVRHISEESTRSMS